MPFIGLAAHSLLSPTVFPFSSFILLGKDFGKGKVRFCMLGKDSAPSGRASWSVLAMNPGFPICSRLKQFLYLCLYRNPGQDG